MSSNPLPLRSTSTFPAFLNTQLQFVNHSPDGRTTIGFVWDHVSTGGRLAYSDYTGELRSDQRLRAESVGATFERIIPVKSHLSIVPNTQLLFSFTSMQNEEYQRIYNQASSATANFNALGVGITPGVDLHFQSGPWLLNANVGYHLATAQAFHLVNNKDIKLTRLADQSAVKPQWSGVRIGFTVGRSFGTASADHVMITEASRDQLMSYRGGLSPRFVVGSQTYRKIKHINHLLQQQNNAQIHAYIEQYKSNAAGAFVLGIVGGAMVGWPVGTMLGGGKFNHSVFAVGMSVSTISLILQEVAGYKARKIVRRYNELLQ